MENHKQIKTYVLIEINSYEITDIQVITITPFFIISYGKYEGSQVLLYKYRYYEYIANDSMEYPKVPRRLKPFVLKRLGYMVNYEDKSLSLIYHCPPNGKLLAFSDFKGPMRKLFLLNKVMDAIYQLKMEIQDQDLMTLSPFIFFLLYKSKDSPIAFVDYYFPLLGKYYVQKSFGPSIDDTAMVCLFIAKVFLEEDNSINYYSLVNSCYNDMMQKKNTVMQVFNTIKPKIVKDFLVENYNKEKQFIQLYMKFKANVYEKESKNFHCDVELCKNEGKMLDVCYDHLCSSCSENHSCLGTSISSVNANFQEYQGIKKNIELHKKLSDSISQLKKPDLLAMFNQNVSPTFKNFDDLFNSSFHSKISAYQQDIQAKCAKHSQVIKVFLNEKAKKLEEHLKECQNKTYRENLLDNDIEKFKEDVDSGRYEILCLYEHLNYFPQFSKLIEISTEYYKTLKTFRENILKISLTKLSEYFFSNLSGIFDMPKLYLQNVYDKNHKRQRLAFPNMGTDYITIFEENKGKTDMLTAKFEENSILEGLDYFPTDCRWKNFYNYVLITGGADLKKKTLSLTLLFNDDDLSVRVLSSMNYPRKSHSLCRYNKYFLIVAGGYDNDTCEMYSILSNHWTILSKLNVKRANGGLCIINRLFLYIFGGESIIYNSVRFENSIEYINVYTAIDPQKSWNVIEYKSNYVMLNLSNFGIIRAKDYLSDSNRGKVIIVGGMNTIERNSYSKKILELDVFSGQLNEQQKCLAESMYFLETKFIHWETKIVQVGSPSNNLQMYKNTDINFVQK